MKDGGPAFPMPSGPEPRVDEFTHYNEGISMRDYFAANAPEMPDWFQGLSKGGGGGSLIEAYFEWPWYYADTMLKAREEK